MALIHWYKLEEDGRDSVGDLHLYEYEVSSGASDEVIYYKKAKLHNGMSRDYVEGVPENNRRAARRLRSAEPFQPDGDVSISAWFSTAAVTNHIRGIVNFFNHKMRSGLTLFYRSNSFSVGVGLGDTRPNISATSNFEADKFYHVVCVYRRAKKTIELYLDGELKRTETDLDMLVGESYLEIGAWGTSYSDYGGRLTIDDVRIYDHALSKGEIKELAQGLTAHFKFDGDLHDCAQGTVGQYLGTNETYIEGKFGEQALKNPKDVDLKLSEGVKLLGTTVSFWALNKPQEQVNTQGYYLGTENKTNALLLKGYPSNQLYIRDDGSYKGFGYNIPEDEWTHLTTTFDDSGVSLYVNGEFENKITNVEKLQEHKITNIANNLYGMDDVRIYTTVLSPEDIKDLYLNRMKIYDNGSIGVVYLDEIEVQENKPISLTDSKLIANIYEVDENGDPIEEFFILEDGIYAPEFREV